MKYLKESVRNLALPGFFRMIWNEMIKDEDMQLWIEDEKELQYIASAKISQDAIVDLDTVIMKKGEKMYLLTLSFDESDIDASLISVFDHIIKEKMSAEIQHVVVDTKPYSVILPN